MSLSIRLKTILDYLEPNLDLADIGCDHGYLSIEYAKNNDCKVLAIDNKKGPLESAKTNIKNSKLDNKISTNLSSGIESITQNIKQIVIAGMGGNNIVEILYKDFEKLKYVDYMVLQPNNNSFELRQFLNSKEYKIIDECLVLENDYIYEILKVVKGKQDLTYKDLYFGPIIRKNIDAYFISKYSSYMNYLETVYKSIPDNKTTKVKKETLLKEIKLLKDELKV